MQVCWINASSLNGFRNSFILFGGDPTKVATLGESAGASAVEAHITAYGGNSDSSQFRGTIAQIPYYLPTDPLP